MYESCRQSVGLMMQGHQRKGDGRNFLPGTVADRAMRAYLEQPGGPVRGTILDPVDSLLEKYTADDAEYVIRWRGDKTSDYRKVREVVIKVLTNLEPLLWEHVIPFAYEPELRFSTTIGVPDLDGVVQPVELIGGMDILVASLGADGEAEDFRVYDLKATENSAYVQGSILAQLTFYAIAVKAMFGKYPSSAAFLTPGCPETFVPVIIGEAEIRHMYARIVAYCHGVWSGDFSPKDKIDSECHYSCNVKHACGLFALPPGGPISFVDMAAQRAQSRGLGA
jgi:hypothetical protein